jgi:hypothetical protein
VRKTLWTIRLVSAITESRIFLDSVIMHLLTLYPNMYMYYEVVSSLYNSVTFERPKDLWSSGLVFVFIFEGMV